MIVAVYTVLWGHNTMDITRVGAIEAVHTRLLYVNMRLLYANVGLGVLPIMHYILPVSDTGLLYAISLLYEGSTINHGSIRYLWCGI